MDVGALRPTPREDRAPGQVRQGLRYVAHTPDLLVSLMMLAVVGTLAYEFQVVLPLLATGTLGGGAGTYGPLTSAMGAGAIVGGLVVAGRGRTGLPALTAASAVFDLAILALAAAPSVGVALVALTVVGAASVTFLAVGNTTLRLTAAPRFRGRVMALWAVAFLGSTPLGAPIVGAVSEHLSPRGGLVIGGLACLAAAGLGRSPSRAGVAADRARWPERRPDVTCNTRNAGIGPFATPGSLPGGPVRGPCEVTGRRGPTHGRPRRSAQWLGRPSRVFDSGGSARSPRSA